MPSSDHTRLDPSTFPPSDAPEHRRLDLSAAQVVASAFAAVTATVVASFFGVAGTLFGAALASVVTVVGNAIYMHSLRRTGERVRVLVPAVRTTASEALRPTAAHVPEPSHPRQTDRAAWLRRSWPRLAAAAVALFLAIIAAVTVFEALAGRPVADVVRGRPGSGTSVFGNQPASSTPSSTTTPQTSTTTSSGAPDTSSNRAQTSTTSGAATTASTTVTESSTPSPAESASP